MKHATKVKILSAAAALFFTAARPSPAQNETSAAAETLTPSAALLKLTEGHARFLVNQPERPNATKARRNEIANEQHPFATILTCSDSRLPVEVLFDQGFGDLFVVRVAGNVASTDEIASAEYGAGHLNVPLLVVLGHTRCGAVTAATQAPETRDGNIPRLLAKIAPAVEEARAKAPNANQAALINAAVRCNVLRSIQATIERSEEVKRLISEKKLMVVGGVYDLSTGVIDWMGEHPRQALLVRGKVREMPEDVETEIETAEAAAPSIHPTTAPAATTQPAQQVATTQPAQVATTQPTTAPAAHAQAATDFELLNEDDDVIPNAPTEPKPLQPDFNK